MDVSAFEATASDVPDPPLSDVSNLAQDDLRYVIAGAIAVVKHIIKLVVCIIAAATCVAIQCLVLNWLCLLWLQTRLLPVTAAVLRSSMDEPRRSRLDASQACRQPMARQPVMSVVRDQEEEFVRPDVADQSQKPTSVKSSTSMVEPDHHLNASQVFSRPQMPEEWREPDVLRVDERKQEEDVANDEDPASAVMVAAAEENDVYQEQEQVQWPSFGHHQYPTVDLTFERDPVIGHTVSMPSSKPRSRRGPTEQPRQSRAQRLEPPKLPKDQQKAQDQESWLDQLTSDPPPDSRTTRAPDDKSMIRQPPANPFNLGFTAEQLDAAAEFAATATRGGEKSKRPVTSAKPTNAPSKASKSSTLGRSRRSQPVMMHAGNANVSPAGPTRPVQGASAGKEATTTSRPASASIPPHLRKTRQAASKRGVSERSFTETLKAPTVETAASQTAKAQIDVQPEANREDYENVAPAVADEDVEYTETRQPETERQQLDSSDEPAETSDRQTPVLRQQTTRLDFYDDTPLLENPAPRAVSPKTLKQWNTPTSSEMQLQAMRLQNSNGGLLVAKPHVYQLSQSSRHPKHMARVVPAGLVRKPNPFDSSPAAATYERPDESDPFMTPVKNQDQASTEQLKKEDETHQHRLDLETGNQSSLQREFPSAAEFEAAPFAQQVHEDLEEQEQKKTTKPSNADEKAEDEVEEPSTASSNLKANIAQQAVKIIQDQTHIKHASTSTYDTTREDATPTQHAGLQSNPTSLRKTGSVMQVTSKEITDGTPGSKSSKLTPSAPSFFAPGQSSNTYVSTPRQSPTPDLPPTTSQESYAIHTSFPGRGQESTGPQSLSHSFATNVQQTGFPSTPQTQQYLAGPELTYGYASAPSYTSAAPVFAPHPVSAAMAYAPLPGLPQFTPRTELQYAPMSAPSMPIFGPGGPVPINPYLPRAASSMPSFSSEVNMYSPGFAGGPAWTGQDDLPSLAQPRFLGDYRNSASHEYNSLQIPPQTPYAGNQWPLSSGVATSQPSLAAAMTVPLRRPSLAVPITRPPPTPIRPFDLKSDLSFAPLRTAPLLCQVPTLMEGVPKPPGLGNPEPSRQVAFDALVREVSPHRRPVIPTFSGVDPAKKAVDEAQARIRQLAQLKDFADSFKLPASLESQHVDGDQPLDRLDSSISRGEVKKVETSTKETPVEDEAKQASTTTNEPKKTVFLGNDDVDNDQEPAAASSDEMPVAPTEEPLQTVIDVSDYDGNDKEPVPAPSDKKAKREAKKVAREALTEAWCAREIARKKVVGSWSPEGAMDLRESTIRYHERRGELESQMGGGKLNGEDAKVFPQFPDLDLSIPKVRPEGAIDAQKKRKDDKTGSPPEGGSTSHGLMGGSGENRKASNTPLTGQASPLSAEIDNLREKLQNAQKLLIQARDYKKQGRPQSNISYATWKRGGDAKVERATKFYRNKREGLAAAFSDGRLPDRLAEEYPLI